MKADKEYQPKKEKWFVRLLYGLGIDIRRNK